MFDTSDINGVIVHKVGQDSRKTIQFILLSTRKYTLFYIKNLGFFSFKAKDLMDYTRLWLLALGLENICLHV